MARDLLALTKPAQTLLLMVAMYGGYFAAGGPVSPLSIALLTAIGWSTISGTTAINMFIEIDIDGLMRRTRGRPLPSGRLPPVVALAFGMGLFTAGAALAYMTSPELLLAVMLGYFFDIVVYTNMLKRFTCASVVLGGVAGAMPAAGGWAYARGGYDLGALLVALIVLAWIPMHIWFIATYYSEDYRLAGIPMLPVVSGVERVASYIVVSLLLLLASVWSIYLYQGYGLLTALATTLLTLRAVRGALSFRKKPSAEGARRLFKAASPLLATVFVLLSLEANIPWPG